MTRKEAAKKASEAAAAKLLAIPIGKRIRESSRITESGCWEWTRYRYSNGYAALSVGGKQRLAHRVSYETFVGEIPVGLTIDHLCRNRACVNPAHLEPVTSGENTRRAMRTHCVNGHPFSEEKVPQPVHGREPELPQCTKEASLSALTPAEAVIGGTILYAASDPRIRAMVDENDEQHFIEGCKAPWFDQLVGQALVAVRETS